MLVGGTVVAVGIAVPPQPEPAPAIPPPPAAVKQDKIETKELKEEQTILFEKIQQNDSSLEKGKTVIAVAGANGIRTITYKMTYKNDIETNREKISDEVTQQPVNEVTKIGTKIVTPPPSVRSSQTGCDPNYSGCVPIASDVDCAGGSGNGPAYVSGPVQVTGSDIYGLDRDGDGYGCE